MPSSTIAHPKRVGGDGSMKAFSAAFHAIQAAIASSANSIAAYIGSQRLRAIERTAFRLSIISVTVTIFLLDMGLWRESFGIAAVAILAVQIIAILAVLVRFGIWLGE
jgi:hypothetical protein